MFVVSVIWDVTFDTIETFKILLVKQAENSLALEEDCVVFDICQDVDEPSRFLLYEVYTTAEAFRKHCETDHFHRFSAAVEAMTTSKNVNQFNRLN